MCSRIPLTCSSVIITCGGHSLARPSRGRAGTIVWVLARMRRLPRFSLHTFDCTQPTTCAPSLLPPFPTRSAVMSSGTPGEGVAPLNFIYACSICCYSFADVYEGRHETVRGFSDGINPKDRLVTHLYLASCCHVFCSSHLENGGTSRHT
jgi:hypothetical protein